MEELIHKLCIHYKYEPSPIGLIGGCSLGLFGGLHIITCYGRGDCESYNVWMVEGRHNDPTIMLCLDCGWTGELKDCTHTYIQINGEDVEPIDYCPKCGGDIFPKE